MTSRSSAQAKAWPHQAKAWRQSAQVRLFMCLVGLAALPMAGSPLSPQAWGRQPEPQVAPPPDSTTQPSTSPSTRPSTRNTNRLVATQPSAIKVSDLPVLPKPVVEKHATPPALSYATPDSIDELRSLERNVEEVSQKVIPATVCLQIGAASGSGVIVSPEGWILTAGHVSGKPSGMPVTIVLHDGRKIKGVTCGANNDVDSGLVRITDPMPPGGWPVAPMGTSGDLQIGQWLIAIGHPGGYKYGRAPVVRLGRLVGVAPDGNTLTTDNTLVGGDSGGPLYDLDGRVVGIHSRIAPSVMDNMHVPVDVFVKDWDKISQGDVWGSLGGAESDGERPQRRIFRTPYFGYDGTENMPENGGVRIKTVLADSPAAKAGLKPGDIIVECDGKQTKMLMNLIMSYSAKKAGDVVKIKVKREGSDEPVELKVTLGEPLAATRPSTKPSTNLPATRPSTKPAAPDAP